MAYEKNTWANGDVITANKLNNIENGINSSCMFIQMSFDETKQIYTSDVLFEDVVAAFMDGVSITVDVPYQESYAAGGSTFKLLMLNEMSYYDPDSEPVETLVFGLNYLSGGNLLEAIPYNGVFSILIYID